MGIQWEFYDMNIYDHSAKQDLTIPFTHLYVERSGIAQSRTQPVLTEHSMFVQILNGPELRFVCMADHLPELIAGHLLTEGFIRHGDEIAEITVDETGMRATVRLNTSLPDARHPLSAFRGTDWSVEHVFSLADAFAGEMPLHNMTFAAHSCFLARKGKILFACEDLGRHNALDKAVGYAIVNHLDPAECILYSSGRMPIDMVSKAIRSGFPVLISKGSPTAGAVELAREYGLTLICSARRDGFKVFSDGRK